MKLITLTEFVREQGHCWVFEMPLGCALGNDVGHLRRSDLLLFEDDTELGPRHAMHDDIRDRGMGAYSHWGKYVYLSTSDNSDLQSNGRRYHAVAPLVAEVKTKHRVGTSTVST